MIWKTLMALVVMAMPAVAGSTESKAAPDMVVIVANMASCKCTAQENVTITLGSGQCTVPNSAPNWPKHDCYVKTEAPANPAPDDPHGRCYIPEACPQVAKSCAFGGFNITVTQRWCHNNNNCCTGGAGTVKKDGTPQGAITPGVAVGPITCDPGALGCGKSKTNVIKVTCNTTGAIMFRVQASFDCNNCPAAPADADGDVGPN